MYKEESTLQNERLKISLEFVKQRERPFPARRLDLAK